jgi:hypothetical protein
MGVTITIKDLLLILLGIGGIVLLFYLILCAKNLVATIKSANIILKDAEEISDIAASRAKDVDGIIENVSGSVSAVAKNLKGEGGLISTISSAIALLTSLKGLFSEKKSEKKPSEAEKNAKNKK